MWPQGMCSSFKSKTSVYEIDTSGSQKFQKYHFQKLTRRSLPAQIVKELGLKEKGAIYVYLDGFLLGPKQDVGILRDNDCLYLVPNNVHTQLQVSQLGVISVSFYH